MNTKTPIFNTTENLSLENIIFKPFFVFYTLFFCFFSLQFIWSTGGYFAFSLDIKCLLNLLFLGYYFGVSFLFTQYLFKKRWYTQSFFVKSSVGFVGGILLMVGQIIIC